MKAPRTAALENRLDLIPEHLHQIQAVLRSHRDLEQEAAALQARLDDYDRIVSRALGLKKSLVELPGGHRSGRGLRFALLAIRARGLVRGASETPAVHP